MKKIVFSATGRTEKCADAFCSVSDNVKKIDLSVNDFENITLSADDFCLVAMPVYGGRVPGCAVDNMAKICANGAKAVIMAVYGNRAYDNALAEIKAVCEKQGFTVIAGCAAIAQHSMLPQVAENRPDEKDIFHREEHSGPVPGALPAPAYPAPVPIHHRDRGGDRLPGLYVHR